MHRIDPGRKSRAEVRRMFDAIAPRYDLLNRLLSARSDVRWRRRAVAAALAGCARPGEVDVLDVCCGTGDLALSFARDPRVRAVTGFDFSSRMVAVGRRKAGTARGPRLAVADAVRLPLRERSMDVVSIAFGLRNLVDPVAGLAEFARVLRPGGRLAILEFFRPEGSFGARLFRGYFRQVLPRLGRLLTRGAAIDAYRYLPDSVEEFASAPTVGAWCRAAGFDGVEFEPFLFGAVVLVTARRSQSAAPPARVAEATACVA
jgi:demethylmenaquinone methyltransferase/2-methoxy-6-polyprenyl-1,4-benzoquinol methylase